MSDWQIDERQLLELNTFLQRTDDVIITNCFTRTAQESKLFPLMPYLMLCFLDAYYRFPDLIRKATAQLSPEDMGHRARNVNTHLGKLPLWGTLNFYLNGRAELIRLGMLRAEDNLEDLWTVTDFWRRYSRAAHRNGAHEWALDAGDIAQEHDERQLQVFEADAFEADSALRAAAAKFLATATQYNFLVHSESRVGLHSSGPYQFGERLLMHTRDFSNAAECDLPWLDEVAEGVTFNNLTVVVITDGVSIDITDFSTPYTTPEGYQDSIVGVGLYTSDFLSDRYEPIGMGSARELTDTFNDLTEEIGVATRKLYTRFAAMSFDQMVEAGMYTYFHAPASALHMAGEYDTNDWFFVDDRTRRFWPIQNEEFAMDQYVGQFHTMDGLQGSANEYYLHPVAYDVWRRGGGKDPLPTPGRNAVPVPAHVLRDHDYPRRVNPNGLSDATGTSKLEPKRGLYTYAGGKWTQDEVNEKARAFNSPLIDGPWRNFDEQTVKWNYANPEVEAMYHYTQETSRLLQGQGSALVREDVDRLRTDAGERPWRTVTASESVPATDAVTA